MKNLALALTAAPLLIAAQPAAVKPLPGEDQMALRCGVVFAFAAGEQARGAPGTQGWPPLAARGREFFARSGAQAMDDTGMSREALSDAVNAEAQALQRQLSAAPDRVKALTAALQPCLPLLGPMPAE